MTREGKSIAALLAIGYFMVIGGAIIYDAHAAAQSRRGANLHVDQGHPVHLFVHIGDTVSLINDLTQEECERARQEVEGHVDGSKAWCWR